METRIVVKVHVSGSSALNKPKQILSRVSISVSNKSKIKLSLNVHGATVHGSSIPVNVKINPTKPLDDVRVTTKKQVRIESAKVP